MAKLTVVYDGSCGVCEASVRWLSRRDPGDRFSFVRNGAADLPAATTREEAMDTVVVLEGPSKWTHAAAVARLLQELPGFRLLARVLQAPGMRGFADAGYRAFARRRHRVSALLGLDACAVPPRRS